jgi:hypothetical protein
MADLLLQIHCTFIDNTGNPNADPIWHFLKIDLISIRDGGFMAARQCVVPCCRTVSSLASNCPDFWRSRQLWEHISHGCLVEADPAFFAKHLLEVLQPEGSGDNDHGSHSYRRSSQASEEAFDRRRHAARRLTAAIDAFVSSSPYTVLCRQLLHLLPPKDAVAAAHVLTRHLHGQTEHVHGRTVRHMGVKELSQSVPGRTSGSTSCGRSTEADMAASSPSSDSMLAARQLAMHALLADMSDSSTQYQDLNSLLVAHGAVIRSGHMLRWLCDDPDGAQVHMGRHSDLTPRILADSW